MAPWAVGAERTNTCQGHGARKSSEHRRCRHLFVCDERGRWLKRDARAGLQASPRAGGVSECASGFDSRVLGGWGAVRARGTVEAALETGVFLLRGMSWLRLQNRSPREGLPERGEVLLTVSWARTKAFLTATVSRQLSRLCSVAAEGALFGDRTDAEMLLRGTFDQRRKADYS